jgi:hypothetical protein
MSRAKRGIPTHFRIIGPKKSKWFAPHGCFKLFHCRLLNRYHLSFFSAIGLPRSARDFRKSISVPIRRP